MNLGYDIAIVGATGTVGDAILEILHQREFPVEKLYPLASKDSVGKEVLLGDQPYSVEALADFDFSKVQFAFFSAGAAVSEKYVPIAADAGAVVIDNTSQFRYDPDVPLVIPEVNPEALRDYRNRNIIANPNCSTIQMLVALKPIYDRAGIARINVATYQAASGAGRRAIESLARQTASLMSGQEADLEMGDQPTAFNVVPKIDRILDNGYTKEEMKMVWETQKILADNTISVNPTAVRVPVFYGHSEAIHLETLQPISPDEVRDCLSVAPGVLTLENGEMPTAVTHAANVDAVFVGRIRQDISHPNGINLWVVSDNIRKGAALNSIQIAEQLIENDFYR
ncbi:MAG: aspartate-semialdehyde dehydrogenase [Gammaproteobacteria bacterium]|nr:aspartate-semialdehyde dehydrogenase [Gammaproteobacteria bacterium]MCH9744202.1 aspartate-semialdehyde dehydrogenase [Gammaproteobacteria bacterium]